MIDLIQSYCLSESRFSVDENELTMLELVGKTASKTNEVVTAFNNYKSNGNALLTSVLDYGAVGDGVTDDYAAIVECINATAEGGTVTFPAKTFYISGEIIVNKNVHFNFGKSKIITNGAKGFTFTGTLKTTKTLTANYVEATSKNKLSLNSVTNIAVGDLINIVANRGSCELFDTTREYYYKGGNFIVTSISGNDVYFNGYMPFDITAANVNVNIYQPVKVVIAELGLIQGKNILQASNNYAGISIKYGVNCIIENVETDNFQENIALWNCVNCRIENVVTGHAKTTGDSWDGYGISIRSCTNVFLNGIITNSGQHGVTTGGQEPCYNINIKNAILKHEIAASYGYDSHENIINCSLENVIASGFSLSGNTILKNCAFANGENTATTGIILNMAENFINANYKFDFCNFNGASIGVKDNYQIASSTRKYIGQIVLTDCKNFSLASKVNTASSGSKIAVLEKVEIVRAKNYNFSISDLLDDLIVRDSDSKQNTNIIAQIAVSAVYQKIKRVLIENCTFPKVYNCIVFMLTDFVKINGYYHNETDNGSDSQTIANVSGNLHIENMFTSTGQTGLTLTAITKAYFNNVYWKLATSISTQLLQCTRADGKTISGNSEHFDLICATNNDKYKITIAAGVHTLTKVV